MANPNTDQGPFGVEKTARIAAVAAGADAEIVLCRAPYAGTVAITFVPDTVLTGANTDSRTLQAFNHLQDGSGSTKMAERAFVSGQNIPAFDEGAVTAITAAQANECAAGDVISFKSLHVGATGLASPAGLVVATFTRQ